MRALLRNVLLTALTIFALSATSVTVSLAAGDLTGDGEQLHSLLQLRRPLLVAQLPAVQPLRQGVRLIGHRLDLLPPNLAARGGLAQALHPPLRFQGLEAPLRGGVGRRGRMRGGKQR